MRLAVLSSEEMTTEQVDLYREILGGPRGQGPRAVLLASGAGGLTGPGPKSADLDDQEYDTAVTVLGERALVELSTLVGYYATLALQLRIFRVGGPASPAGR